VTNGSSTTSQPSTENAGDAAQTVEPEQPGNGSSKRFGKSDWLPKAWANMSRSLVQAIVGTLAGLVSVASKTWANMSLSRVQAIVGTMAGLVTVAGALQIFGPTGDMGEFVAVVQEAASARSVPDATIEILTPLNALVTTLAPDSRGRAHQRLKEGIYVVRVSHPDYSAEVRQIQVFPRQTVEIKASLRAGSSSPLVHAGRAVKDKVRAVGRVLGF
jgi:hypothetical protein